MESSAAPISSEVVAKMQKTVKRMEKMLSQCTAPDCAPATPSTPTKSSKTRSKTVKVITTVDKSAGPTTGDKAKRGRPPKSKKGDADDVISQVLGASSAGAVQKKRGRPKKIHVAI